MSDAGRFEGRTCGDAQARIPATFGRTRRAMSGFNCHETLAAGESLTSGFFPYLLTFFLPLLLCLLEMLGRARQSKRLSEVCGGKESFARAAVRGTVGEFMIINCLFVSAIFVHVLCGGCCRSAAKLARATVGIPNNAIRCKILPPERKSGTELKLLCDWKTVFRSRKRCPKQRWDSAATSKLVTVQWKESNRYKSLALLCYSKGSFVLRPYKGKQKRSANPPGNYF